MGEAKLGSVGFERVKDFAERYANHAHFVPTAFDLTVIFGELQRDPNNPSTTERTVVEQHSAITVSWAEVKLISFYLQVQILVHEFDEGAISIPARVIPKELPLTEPGLTTEQKRLRESYNGLRNTLLAGRHSIQPKSSAQLLETIQ